MGATWAVRHLPEATCKEHDSHVTVRQAFLSGPHSHEAHLYIHYPYIDSTTLLSDIVPDPTQSLDLFRQTEH